MYKILLLFIMINKINSGFQIQVLGENVYVFEDHCTYEGKDWNNCRTNYLKSGDDKIIWYKKNLNIIKIGLKQLKKIELGFDPYIENGKEVKDIELDYLLKYLVNTSFIINDKAYYINPNVRCAGTNQSIPFNDVFVEIDKSSGAALINSEEKISEEICKKKQSQVKLQDSSDNFISHKNSNKRNYLYMLLAILLLLVLLYYYIFSI